MRLARAAIAATEAIRRGDPTARFVAVDPVINVVTDPGRPWEASHAEGHRQARFQGWNLIAGRIWPQIGGRAALLDIVGVNYYHNNPWIHGGPPIDRHHPLHKPFRRILAETGIEGDARTAWLAHVMTEIRAARALGVPVEGVCLYPVRPPRLGRRPPLPQRPAAHATGRNAPRGPGLCDGAGGAAADGGRSGEPLDGDAPMVIGPDRGWNRIDEVRNGAIPWSALPLFHGFNALSAARMRSDRTATMSGAPARRWLMLLVHCDAMRSAPRAYWAAIWWRLRGKRLRAHARLAPLLGASARSYRLWRLREASGEGGRDGGASHDILALVDVGAGRGGLDATLRSLSDEGLPALLVGGPDGETPAALAERIDWRDPPWLMPLSAGDVLATGAVTAYEAALARTDARIVYADDDMLDDRGERLAPHFKPDWNAELFRHFDYLSGACIVQATRAALANTGDADWTQRLVLGAAAGTAPLHLHRVLHHRRTRPRPRLPATPLVPASDLPTVSVIVPTRNRVDLLETCLEGIATTDYPEIEVIVVDNDSDDPRTLAFLSRLDPARTRVLRHAGAFNFGAMNNRAARRARGRMLCLLNNDIEVLAPDWLAIMVTQALRGDVGAVGARLLYPDGRIQHAGVVLGVGGGAAHAHRFLRPDEEGYHHRHALPQFVSAVTAACLVVARDRFMAVDGFDERAFPVAFNDVDLCMRLNRRGWQSLYEPRATLIHHESVSRGSDRDPAGARRLAGELAALKARWGTGDGVDPFHHPELSPFSERFVVRI